MAKTYSCSFFQPECFEMRWRTFSLQVLDFIRNHKGMAHHPFSCKEGCNVNVQQVIKTLKPAFSPQGNQRRIKEEVVMAKFIAFLTSIEGKYF